MESGLSDHSLIFVCWKREKLLKEKQTLIIWNLRNFDPQLYCRDIELADWSSVYTAHTIDEAVANFYRIFH